MANTACPKCKGSHFEVVLNTPSGSNFSLVFVQCAKCGVPIGVTNYHYSGALLKEQELAIERLGERVTDLERSFSQRLDDIESSISRLRSSLPSSL